MTGKVLPQLDQYITGMDKNVICMYHEQCEIENNIKENKKRHQFIYVWNLPVLEAFYPVALGKKYNYMGKAKEFHDTQNKWFKMEQKLNNSVGGPSCAKLDGM